MKILLLTQYYPPENTLISPTLARHLQAEGHEVRVLTGYPNYPEGKTFPGYSQRWRTREVIEGIDTLRVPLWTDHSQNPLKRILNYASFAVSAATAHSFARGADVIYVYATQMTPALGPWLWRLLGGAPYVLHVQDLWPDSIIGSSILRGRSTTKLIAASLNPWLRSVYRRAAAVIGIAPTMVKTLADRGADERTTHLVYNWAEESSIESKKPTASETSDTLPRIRLLYAGNVGDMQDLENVVLAVHRTRHLSTHLTILGDGVALPRLRSLVDSIGATNVAFLGRVPRKEMGRYYASADFAVVSLKDLPNFYGTIPSKFQAALSHGTPIITTVQGDVRDLVSEHGLGVSANAEDLGSIEGALRHVAALTPQEIARMGDNAGRAYYQLFSQKSGLSSITSILERVGCRVDTRDAS